MRYWRTRRDRNLPVLQRRYLESLTQQRVYCFLNFFDALISAQTLQSPDCIQDASSVRLWRRLPDPLRKSATRGRCHLDWSQVRGTKWNDQKEIRVMTISRTDTSRNNDAFFGSSSIVQLRSLNDRASIVQLQICFLIQKCLTQTKCCFEVNKWWNL